MNASTVRRVSIEVHYTVHLDEKDVARVLAYAEEVGQTYGDPGKKETIRRVLIEEGCGILETLLHDPLIPRTEHPVKV